MSHELRTPLNAILGFSDLLSTQKFGPLNQKQSEYLGYVRSSGAHLLGLITNVLDLSKAEAGKLELYEDTVGLDELLGECGRVIGVLAEDAGLEFAWRLPASAVELRVDPVKVKQILINLLGNAVKFTPAGGRVEMVASMLADGGLELIISDTGVGMSPEQIPLALEPFVQIENSFNRLHHGTGLGLPLCKQLIELHGGRLQIQSTPGHGTSIGVWIPPERVVARLRAVKRHKT